MKLIYHGHSAWEVHAGGARIWIDPFLSQNPRADVDAENVQTDYIIVSHAHHDHVGDTEAIARRTGAIIIGMNELVVHFRAAGLAGEALQIGGGQDFPFGRVKLVRALHSSSSADGAYMGTEAGILLTDREGTVLYHAGDTGLFGDMSLIGRAGIDVALLPIGDKFTMGPDDAVAAVELLHPRLAVPMHYNTWPVIMQDPEAWKRAVETLTDTLVTVMQPGDSMEVHAGH